MQKTEAKWVDREAYPFAPHFLKREMGDMHYVDEGSGPVLLMVHGTPTWSFLYRHLIKELSANFRCVAPDHIGFGLSDKPEDWSYLPKAHAKNLHGLIDKLHLRDITLVVHDFGGPIGMAYAVECPENVRNIIVLNSWMWSLQGDPHFEQSKRLGGAIGKFLYERENFSVRVMMKMAMGDKAKLTPDIQRQYLDALPTPQSRHGTWVFAHELIGSSAWYDSLWQQREHLQDKPALILWGMKDVAFRTKELDRWTEAFPNARIHRFEHAGHFVPEEEGAALCPLIEDFLHA